MRETLASFNGPFFWRKGMTSTRRTLMVLGVLAVVLAASTGVAQAQVPPNPGQINSVLAYGYGALQVSIQGASGILTTDQYQIRYAQVDSGTAFPVGEDTLVLTNPATAGDAATLYVIPNLEHGKRYIVAARTGRTAAGTTTWSASWAGPTGGMTATAPALGQVMGLKLEALDGGLKASWTAIADPIGRPLARYRVDVSASPAGGSFSSQMWVDGDMTEATIMNLMNGVEYTVTVRAQASKADGMPDTARAMGPPSESMKATPMAGAGGTDPEPDPDPMPTPTPAVPLVGILALFAGLLAAGRARLRR